jgi:hypothetical protein
MKLLHRRSGVVVLASLLVAGVALGVRPADDGSRASTPAAGEDDAQAQGATMNMHYLEVVTPSVHETCEALAEAHGVTFSDPIPALGNARTADLAAGGRIGVRAPLRETEQPVVRPYVLVDDIDAAIEAAKASGAEVALPPMEIPGEGTISIYILGGIEHGLWQR